MMAQQLPDNMYEGAMLVYIHLALVAYKGISCGDLILQAENRCNENAW